MEELRKIQAERYARDKARERKEKEDAERVIWEGKLKEFEAKITQKCETERRLKEENHPAYYATKLVRFVKPWFKKVPEEFKMFGRRDMFQMPEGDLVSIERLQEIVSILGIEQYSEFQKRRISRMLRFVDEDKHIRYWQDRDYEKDSICKNYFILEAMLMKFYVPTIEFIPMFEKWIEAFPFEDPFEFLQNEKVCLEKEESNVFKTWRLMRLILIASQQGFYFPWDLGINEDEFKIYLFQELENALNGILRVNRMLEEEPVELEIKCAGCGKTNEQHWVFCYGRKFRLCRYCATQISPEHRTEINQEFPNEINQDYSEPMDNSDHSDGMEEDSSHSEEEND